MPLTSQPSLDYAFKNLRCLALNRVYFPWDEVQRVIGLIVLHSVDRTNVLGLTRISHALLG